VLHEDLIPPGADAAFDPEALARAVFGPEPRAAKNPTAIGAGSKILPEPSTREPRQDGEILHGRRGKGSYAGDRLTSWNPDYQTSSDGTLEYVEVFNPSIVPFKRMTALDAVDANFRLITHTEPKRDLRVGGKENPDEDLFWGSLVLMLKPGEEVAIPSVSPDMRILSYEISPNTQVTFSKDDADTYYVRSDELGATGEHRLVFLVAARSSYFSAAVPRKYRVGQVASAEGRPRMSALPDVVKQSATRALMHPDLQITDRMRLDIAVDRLVEYFRSFKPQPAPRKSDNIYWDLFASRAGVCRHRAYAFMITANAAGIPARYLANEAHAWVEIWVPERGWLRIDLGGAALRLRVGNADGKTMYRPRGEDPFPKPQSYAQNYTRLEGDVSGLSGDQLAEARRPFQEEDRRQRPERDGGENGGRAGDSATGRDADVLPTGPARTLDQIPPEEIAGKSATRIQVQSVDPVGFRGETIAVSGMVTDDKRHGVEGLRVDIWVAPTGTHGENAVLLGRTASVTGGVFAAKVQLPVSLPLAEYDVYVTTTGDQHYQPSKSD
jgi:transglutaminase-like putative cysteine protease